MSILAAVLLAACSWADPPKPGPDRPFDTLHVGESLDATFEDPILLTVAAAAARTEYLVDEGYTLTRSPDGVIYFATDTAGDFGLALEVDGRLLALESDWFRSTRILTTTSDSILIDFEPTRGLSVEVRFVAVTSRAASMQIVLTNTSNRRLKLAVIPWIRRCEGGFTEVAGVERGIEASHRVRFDPLTLVVGPGTTVEDLRGALVADSHRVEPAAIESCSPILAEDLAALGTAGTLKVNAAPVVALREKISLAGGERTLLTYLRAVVEATKSDTLPEELELAGSFSLPTLIQEGVSRLSAMPSLAGLTHEAALVYRSCFVLLDQLKMPAEGRMKHDYYLFSREPTWWFARLGQHIHESLSMILMTKFDPRFAVESQRNFVNRIDDNGYLPYNIGPVVEQTALGTASAPLFSYVSSEILKSTRDSAFLREAYDTGRKLYAFWLAKRDADRDGLTEWGGYPVTESLRDLDNVIWTKVASPDTLETIDPNVMFVMEAKSLAEMAGQLGLPAEADDWRARAAERVDRINRTLWDEATRFYYHVEEDTETFSFRSEGDLRRMEIAGFLPLWAGMVPDDRWADLRSHLTDSGKFFRPYGISSLSAEDPFYSPAASKCCRWNGAVWVPWQWLIVRGLLDAGETDLPREITRRTLEAVKAQLRAVHQFRELYNPDDSSAPNNSMPNYIWSSMIALMMIETAP